MKSQRSMLGASCPVSRWHYSYCWQMQRKQDVARGQEQPGSPWMQRNPALKQQSFVRKAEGPAFSWGVWWAATYHSYFSGCLCFQLYSVRHFAFKYSFTKNILAVSLSRCLMHGYVLHLLEHELNGASPPWCPILLQLQGK